jgi:DNA-binding NarL/FixJ family response regulator
VADPRDTPGLVSADCSIRVLIVDDHPAVRRGLRMFLETYPDMTVVGEAADGDEALRLATAERPDVVLLDLMMPGMDGVEVLTTLAERGLTARVLVVTSFVDRSNVLPAMRAGARGYVYKDVDPQALVAAVRSVYAGHVLLELEIAQALFAGHNGVAVDRDPAADASLTARERDVLRLIAAGESNREIARKLVVSEKTVKTHVSNILLKLGLADRTQAALFAVRHGLAGDD